MTTKRWAGVFLGMALASGGAMTLPSEAQAQRAQRSRVLELMIRPSAAGAVVLTVRRGPGQEMGFVAGDVIVAVSGERVSSASDVDGEISNSNHEDLDLDVVRGGQHLHVTVFFDAQMGGVGTYPRAPRLH